MSRFDEFEKQTNKNGFEAKKDDLQTLFELGEKYLRHQREEFAGNFDMECELDKAKLLSEIAKKVYPNNVKVYVAAFLCNIGRGNEYKMTGGFNGKGEFDYREIGPAILDKLWIQNGGDMLSRDYQQVRNAVEFHGGKTVPEWIAAKDMDIINAVSVVYSIVQGGTVWKLIYREQQIHARSTERGGFIPKENQWSKEITPALLKIFKAGKTFNIEECKTYPDYFLYYACIVMCNLKSDNQAIAAAQAHVLEMPAREFIYFNAEGEPLAEGEAFYKRNIKGKFVMANKEGVFDE